MMKPDSVSPETWAVMLLGLGLAELTDPNSDEAD